MHATKDDRIGIQNITCIGHSRRNGGQMRWKKKQILFVATFFDAINLKTAVRNKKKNIC